MVLLVFVCLLLWVFKCWTTFLPQSLLSVSPNREGYRTSSLLRWILNAFVFLRIDKVEQMIIKKQANDTNSLLVISVLLSICLLFPLELLVFVLGIYFQLGEINLNNLVRGVFGMVWRLEMIRLFCFWIWFLSVLKNSFSCTLSPHNSISGSVQYFISINIHLGLPCISPEMVDVSYHMREHW